MKKSLKNQIFIVVFSFGVILILLSKFFIFSGLQSQVEEKIGNPQVQIVKGVFSEIDRTINDKFQIIKRLAENKDISIEKIDDTKNLLEINKIFTDEWEEVSITAPSGIRILSSDKKQIGTNIRDESEIFQQIMYRANLDQGSVSDVYLDKFNSPILALAYPIKNEFGDISGIAVGKLRWEFVQSKLPTSDVNKFYLLSKQGVLLATNILKDRAGVLNDNFSKNQIFIYADTNPPAAMITDGMFISEKSLVAYSKEEGFGEYAGNHWLLVMEIPTNIFFESTQRSFNIAVILLALLIFSTFGTLLLFLIRLIINPVRSIVSFVTKISAGDFSSRYGGNEDNEIGGVGLAINKMAEKIESYQKDFEVRIDEKTEELQKTLLSVEEKNSSLENTKKAMFSLLQDINSEKKNIAAQRARTEIILASIGDAVFATDLKGKIIITNKALERLLGYVPEQLYEEDYREFLMPKNEKTGVRIDLIETILKEKHSISIPQDFNLTKKDGLPVEVSITASPITDTNQVIFGMIVILHDMTKERELEKAKDSFLSIAAHQLRTPLGSVRWNLEMLLGDDIKKIGDETREVLKQIEESNRRMIDLTNNLLDVSRIDQGRVTNEPANIEILQIIKESIKEMEPIASKNGIVCTVKSEKPEIFAFADPKKVREVIQNLVSNGVKYNIIGGKLEVMVVPEKDFIKIAIKDTGIGIPKEEHSQIYGKFFRAKNAILSETEGTGLGLYVVKSYVESWGGQIWFESENGKGTTFHLTIPISQK